MTTLTYLLCDDDLYLVLSSNHIIYICTTLSISFSSLSSENLVINWPDGAEDDIADEGKEIVELLLQHNPEERLGSSATGGL